MKKRGNQDFPFNDVSPSEDRFNTELVKPSDKGSGSSPVSFSGASQDARNTASRAFEAPSQKPQANISKAAPAAARPAFDASFFDDSSHGSGSKEKEHYQSSSRQRFEDSSSHPQRAETRDPYEDRLPKIQKAPAGRRTLDLQIQILSVIAGVMLIVVLILLYLAIFGGRKDSATAAATNTSATQVSAGITEFGSLTPIATTLGVSITPDPLATTTPSETTADTDPSSLANMPPSAEHPVIALTFDDGPSATYTPQLLDVLKEKGVPVTFFLLGVKVADADPALLQRMVAEGHEIGNHSYDHSVYTKITEEEIREQLQKTNDLILAATGITPTVMRPPQGGTNDTVLALSKEFNMACVNWSWESCPEDWEADHQTPEFISNHVIENAANGHIVLLHDIHQATVESVAAMIDGLIAKGYRFATVSDLLATLPEGEQSGVMYYYGRV